MRSEIKSHVKLLADRKTINMVSLPGRLVRMILTAQSLPSYLPSLLHYTLNTQRPYTLDPGHYDG